MCQAPDAGNMEIMIELGHQVKQKRKNTFSHFSRRPLEVVLPWADPNYAGSNVRVKYGYNAY